MPRSPGHRTYRSPSVDRALQVLQQLGDHRETGRTLAELARATGVPPSSLIGIVGSLEAGGLVGRLPSRRYVLDIGVMTLGQAYAEQDVLSSRLAAAFADVGQRLVASFNETVQLGILVDADVVYIARQDSSHPVRLVAKVGRRVPAHASALGKAILATLEPAALRGALGDGPLRAMTPQSITGFAALERELALVRGRGFSESREECIAGLHCVGAPVFGASGAAVAGISISVPLFRSTAARRRAMCSALVAAAGELSHAVPGAALAS